MKLKPNTLYKTNPLKLFVFLIALTGVFFTAPAYSQIDYSYGLNTKGLRVDAGGGVTQLITHYDKNPLIGTFIARLDYDFNPYFTVGLEGQIGTLQGIDTHNPPHLYYTSSTNSYMSAGINARFGLGLIDDFFAKNTFMDAVKRLYIGIGYSEMKKDITFTTDPALAQYAYGHTEPVGYMPVFPFSIGTNIPLINVFGYDRFEINPNFQFNYIPSMYSDGFISSAASHLKGFYNLTSISIRWKL